MGRLFRFLTLIMLLLTTSSMRPTYAQGRPENALNATVSIDAKPGLRIIPRELFGTNIEWAMGMQGIWLRERNTVDPQIVSLSKKLGVSVVRFPAGTGADYYHWDQGIGPIANRRAQNLVISPGSEVNVFGTDELRAFCREIGAKPLLTVNMVTDTAESAARWVDYFDSGFSASRSRDEVYFWELGNEPYMKPDRPETRSSSLSASEYVNRSNLFIEAMRNKHPAIRLAAVGGNNFTRFDFLADKNWNQNVLRGLGKKIDYFCVHNGYAPLIIEKNSYSAEEVYASLMGFPILMEQNLAQVSAQISTLAANPQLKIAVTEWAPLFHVATTSPWVDHPKTLGSGLYSAGVLHAMIRNPRVCTGTFFKLKDLLFGGTIGYNNFPKSSFYVLQMYSKLANHQLVWCKSQSPTYDSKALGLVPEIKQVPYLDVIAAVAPSKQTLEIFAINRSINSPVRAAISIKNLVGASHCAALVFNGVNIDSNNGKDIPDVPGYSWATQVQASSNPQFYKGRPGNLQITKANLQSPNFENFTYVFPAHSLTRLSITAARPK